MSIAVPLEDQMDVDSDAPAAHPQHQTQFTQSLMLFVRPPSLLFPPAADRPTRARTQTQLGGRKPRYVQHLTRFFAQLRPHALLMLVMDALAALGVKQNPAKELTADPDDPESRPLLRMRVGTKDRRKIHMKGYVEIEDFEFAGHAGSFVVLARDAVSPGARLVWGAAGLTDGAAGQPARVAHAVEDAHPPPAHPPARVHEAAQLDVAEEAPASQARCVPSRFLGLHIPRWRRSPQCLCSCSLIL